MSADDTPVADSEFLLRRVPSDPAKFHFPEGPVDLRAFLPSQEDTEGLSLYRELAEGTNTGFLTAEALLGKARERMRLYGGVVAASAGKFRSIGLRVDPDPSDLPGHVNIPQMNRRDYDASKAQKQQIMAWADEIAESALIRIAPRKPPESN